MTTDISGNISRDELDLIHAVAADVGTIFTWDYERSRVPLMKLYEKAKTSQWNASTDLDWSVDVDPEKVADELGQGGTARFQALAEAEDSPVRHFGDKEWRKVGIELQNSLLSQFMHGEQGALLCTARIVETVPWIDAKYYAATQVVDEARHVAFGVLSLQEFYKELTDAEMRERQEFAFDVARRLQRRFAHTEMWARMGVDPEAIYRTMDKVNPPAQQVFQQLLFSKIVPNCKKLGLLDAADGWLRHRFAEIGVIQFEDWTDTGEEYAALDEVERDRQASSA